MRPPLILHILLFLFATLAASIGAAPTVVAELNSSNSIPTTSGVVPFVQAVASTGIGSSPSLPVAAPTGALVSEPVNTTGDPILSAFVPVVASTGLGSSPVVAATTSAFVERNIDLTALVASTGIDSSPVVAAATSAFVPHSIDLTAPVASTGLRSSPVVATSASALVARSIDLADVAASTGIRNSPVMSATTRGFVPEPSNTPGALFVWDQSSASPHPATFPVPVVEHKGSGDSPSPPTNVLISELSNTTAEESTTPDTVPVYVFMDSGSSLPVSPKVIFGIIFAFSLFVALNIAFFCLWNKRFCRSRPPDVPPSRCPHVAMSVSCALTCPRPANPRPLSCETMVGRASDAKDDDSVKHSSAAAGESLELVPVTRPAHAWTTRGRPRAPLVENAF